MRAFPRLGVCGDSSQQLQEPSTGSSVMKRRLREGTCQGHTTGPPQAPTLSWKRKLIPAVKSPRRLRLSGSNEAVQSSAVEGKPVHLSEFLAWPAYAACSGLQKILAHPFYPLAAGKHAQEWVLPQHILLGNSSKWWQGFSESARLRRLGAPRCEACPLTGHCRKLLAPASSSPPSLPAAPIGGL